MFNLYSTRARGNISSGDPSTPASWLDRRCDCPGECFLDSLWDEGYPFPQLTDKIESLTNATIQTDSAGVPYIQCTGDWEIVIKDTWRIWWPFPGIHPGGFFIKINRSSGLVYLKASTLYNENDGNNLIATLTHTWYSLEKPAVHSGGGLLCQGILHEWYPDAPQWGVTADTNYEVVGLTVFHHDEVAVVTPSGSPYYSFWSSIIAEKCLKTDSITDTPSGDVLIRGVPFRASCGLSQVADWCLPKRIWGNGSVKIYDLRRVAQRSLVEGGDFMIVWRVPEAQRTQSAAVRIIFEYNPANHIPGSTDRLPPGVFLFRLKHKLYDAQTNSWVMQTVSDEAALVFSRQLWTETAINSFLSEHNITYDEIESETQRREERCRSRGCLIFVSNTPNDIWFRTAPDISGNRSAFYAMKEDGGVWQQPTAEATVAEIAKLYREIRVHVYCDSNGPQEFSVYTYLNGTTIAGFTATAAKQSNSYTFSYNGTQIAEVAFGEYFIWGLTELPSGFLAWWRHKDKSEIVYSAPLHKNDHIAYLEATAFGWLGTAPTGSFVTAAYVPLDWWRDDANFLRFGMSQKAANNPLVLASCAGLPITRGSVRCPCDSWPNYLIADLSFAINIQPINIYIDNGVCKFSYGNTTTVSKNWTTVAVLSTLDETEWKAPPINLVSSTGCGYGVQWPIAGDEIVETFNSSIPVVFRLVPRFYLNNNCELVGELSVCFLSCPLIKQDVTCTSYDLEGSEPVPNTVAILVPGGIYAVDRNPGSDFSLRHCSSEFELFSETTTETTSAEGSTYNEGGAITGTRKGKIVLRAVLGPVISECDFTHILGYTRQVNDLSASASFKLIQVDY